MKAMDRREAGAAAEAAALARLSARGLQLVARNYRCRGGEIDLVMLDGRTLVLVEVRYRASRAFGGAAASVTRLKQRRIATAARHLLHARAALRNYPVRFDVVAVSPGHDGAYDIEWIKAAFSVEG